MTRNARRSRCPGCGAPVLIGEDGDQCATRAVVDPTPLMWQGEALALLAGRRTYALRPHDVTKLRLNVRDHWQIAGTPAGTSTPPLAFDVVADHICERLF